MSNNPTTNLLSFISSGYNKGVIASEDSMSDKSNPKVAAIDPKPPFMEEFSTSGANAVLVE